MNATKRWNGRQIGPWGTAARACVGAGFLIGAVGIGISWDGAIIGVLVMPVVTMVALALRGRRAPPLRLHGPAGHLANIGIVMALLSAITVPALLFYGLSMLVAAWRGIGACEVFAISNWLQRRDDQLGCPVFLPVDAAEAAAAKVDMYC